MTSQPISSLPTYFLNGKQCLENHGMLDFRDRGLAYGDGVFETMLVTNQAVPFWSLHRKRILKGIQHLAITLDDKQLDQYCQPLFAALRDVSVNCIAKLVVTRGISGRGYTPGDAVNVLAMLLPFTANDLSERGCSVHLCEERLPQPISWAGLKTLNQLSYVLASAERIHTNFDEGLLCTSEGNIIEATARNIFCIRDKVLLTPDLNDCGVAGVMRSVILNQVAKPLGFSVDVRALTLTDLVQSSEVFLCNSVTGIWPVTACTYNASKENVKEKMCYWPIGEGTRKIQSHINHMISHLSL